MSQNQVRYADGFEATRGRRRKVVVYDPIDGVVYSRATRRGAQLREDGELQDLLYYHGLTALRLYATRCCYGYAEAVVA